MKNVSLIVWVSQLGLSVAAPLAGFILLGVWIRSQLAWGSWVIWVAVGLGAVCAVNGFVNALKTLDRMAKDPEEDQQPVAFNDHD